MTDLVPLDNLITALRGATSGGKSGAFFITTENQHSAMITLSEGVITGLKFRSARGYDAAAALAKVEQLKYQTAAEPTELPGENEINTNAVLEILSTGDPARTAADSGRAAPGIDLEALRSRYIAAIGPIAGALFDEAVDELGDRLGSREGVDELIQKLAAQIDDEGEAESFLRDARTGL